MDPAPAGFRLHYFIVINMQWLQLICIFILYSRYKSIGYVSIGIKTIFRPQKSYRNGTNLTKVRPLFLLSHRLHRDRTPLLRFLDPPLRTIRKENTRKKSQVLGSCYMNKHELLGKENSLVRKFKFDHLRSGRKYY